MRPTDLHRPFIDELTRPVDAIRHQAKTVTVGISRTDEQMAELAETSRKPRYLLAIAEDPGAHLNAISFIRVLAETTAAVLVTLAIAFTIATMKNQNRILAMPAAAPAMPIVSWMSKPDA